VPGDKISYNHKVLTINGKEMKQSFLEYTTDSSSGKAVAKYREDLNGIKHDIFIRPDVPSENFEIGPTTPHILLKGISIPFNYLRHYDMKLHFEKAGTIEVTVSVGM
jgi:signal peptidase I